MTCFLFFFSPTPEMEWMKMGDELPTRTKLHSFGKVLTISAIEERDEGKYMCIAKSSAGEAVHYFDVIVEGWWKPAHLVWLLLSRQTC